MARRGGRRGRRSRSRQNRSRRTSSRRRTTTRRSAPSRRRNTRTTTRASNRRANVSRARRAAPKKTAPKKTAPTRRTTPKRGSGISQSRKNIGRNVGTTIKKTVGRITRPPSASAKTKTTTTSTRSAFNKQLKKIQAVNTPSIDASNYRSLSVDQQRAVQQGKYGETFGFNPVTQRNEINRVQNMIKAQNAARLRQGLDPTFSGQSLKQAKDADGDGYADNMGNRIAGVYNATFGRLGLPNMPKQTVAGANISMNRPMGQRLPGLVRKRGSSGGASRIEQQAAAQAVQPEIAPTIGTPPPEEYDFGPAPQGDLTRIQSQAYNEQLSNLMIGGTGSAGYTQQGSPDLSPTLRAGQSRGRRRVRLFGGRRRRGGTGDQFSRAGDRIAKLTNINI